MAVGAGGFKNFGPTFNTTPYVRLGYEGILNGVHPIDPSVTTELAGKFAAINASGAITVAGAGGTNAVGLFREDLGDMQNASTKATFYFRGGEYYVALSRTGIYADTVEFFDTKRNVSTLKDLPGIAGTQYGEYSAGSDLADPADDTNNALVLGGEITCDSQGRIIPKTSASQKALGVVTHLGPYSAGNMYENAGTVANGGDYVGFIMYI